MKPLNYLNGRWDVDWLRDRISELESMADDIHHVISSHILNSIENSDGEITEQLIKEIVHSAKYCLTQLESMDEE